MLYKSGLLSRIVQSRHSIYFVCNSWCQRIHHCNDRSCKIVGGSHVLNKVSRCFRRQCGICLVKQSIVTYSSKSSLCLFVIVGVNKFVTVIVLVK